jgi:predicted  nucleic acid-binding Zn-ribbon protein
VSIREQLVALAKVGRMDASTQELDKELKDIPREVESLRESVALLEGLLAQERAQLEQAENLRTQHESLIKEAQDGISRAKSKAAKAKNAREADAVERELETTRRTVKEREAERDKLTAAIEGVQKSLGNHETEFANLKEVLQQKDAEAQVRIAELTAARDKSLEGREKFSTLVPKDVLARYDALRARKGSAVAEVRDGVCQGCRMSVRPMQFIVIQREEGIERCAQCQRYLYLGAWLADDAAALEAGENGPRDEPDAG